MKNDIITYYDVLINGVAVQHHRSLPKAKRQADRVQREHPNKFVEVVQLQEPEHTLLGQWLKTIK